MLKPEPFSLTIFVVDGDPDGLRLVERSDWNGKVLIFPRASFAQIRNRSEFQKTGVYLLLGPRPDGAGEALYIGEGDPIRPRLDGHYAKKDFWNRAVCFVAGTGQLNKAHVQFLEAQLVQRAKAAKRLTLENGNTPLDPTLSETDRAIMEVFLSKMLAVLPALAIQAFENPLEAQTTSPSTTLLKCAGKGAKATGYDTPQGFVVKAGSSAAKSEMPSFKQHLPNISKLRADLLESGVLSEGDSVLQFLQDYTFNSPSLAAAVVLGRSANGRVDWKDSKGRTLKQLQEQQTSA